MESTKAWISLGGIERIILLPLRYPMEWQGDTAAMPVHLAGPHIVVHIVDLAKYKGLMERSH